MKTNKLLLTATALFAALAFSLTGCKKDSGASSLSLNYNGEFDVTVGNTVQAVLSSGGSAVDASSVTWTQTNGADYFTIDATGLITGVAVGSGQFTAAYNGESKTGYVTVSSNVVTEVPDASVLTAYTEGETFTLVVYVPEESGCNKIVSKATNTQNAAGSWNEEVELTAVEGWDRWYQGVITYKDIKNSVLADGTYTYNLKVCQTDADGSVGGSWEYQWSKDNASIHLLDQTTAVVNGKKPVVEDEGGDGTGTSVSGEPNLKVFESGYVYVQIDSWNDNPCSTEEAKTYTINVTIPECTYEAITTEEKVINLLGEAMDPETQQAFSWNMPGKTITITEGQTSFTVDVYGKSNSTFKFAINSSWDNEMLTDDTLTGGNFTIGNNQSCTITGWKGTTCAPAEEETTE